MRFWMLLLDGYRVRLNEQDDPVRVLHNYQ